MRTVDALVVGAGAAGAAAALAVAQAGGSVLLVDEFGCAGGYLRWSIAEQGITTGIFAGKRGDQIAAGLAEQLESEGIGVMHGVVWGLFEERLAGVVTASRSFQVQPGAIIIASGATDSVAPFAGWDLPGVITARAALRALHEWRVLPGQRVAICGRGSDAAEMRDAIELAGGRVELLGEGLRAGGAQRVAWAEIDGQRAAVDCVVIARGRRPDPELALQALCEFDFSERDQAFVPLRGASLATSLPGVYVVGDAAGTCTTAEAIAEGQLAGLAAAGAEVSSAMRNLAALRSPQRTAELAQLRMPAPAGREQGGTG